MWLNPSTESDLFYLYCMILWQVSLRIKYSSIEKLNAKLVIIEFDKMIIISDYVSEIEIMECKFYVGKTILNLYKFKEMESYMY